MAEEHDNLVQKELCGKEHQVVNDKLADLKANILTSKESMGGKLDKFDCELRKALLGNSDHPGGLLTDIKAMKDGKEKYETSVNKDFKTLEDKVAKDIKTHKALVGGQITLLRYVTWIAFGLSILAFGGKFLGLDGATIKNFFSKTPPIVAPSPQVEEDDSVPSELKILIRELIKEREDYRTEPLDAPKETVTEIISSTEENK